ncbi:MAG: type I DNA topoisomerase, partial [Patescibacteria group bacterium]
KAKTLTRFLGGDYKIMASMGHIRDLPKSKMGIDTEHDFVPEYVVDDKKLTLVKSLQDEAKKAELVILATDPDREGEAISWHIAAIIGKQNYQRITFHEITESAIKEALKNPGKIDMALVDAQQARRILDRLVGYKLSPILWRKVRRGLSAGRVQSVAVRLIVEREKEVLAFKSLEYWELDAQFENFKAKLIKTELKNKDETDRIIESLKVSEFKVEEVNKKEVKRSPYPPFTTSTLQQAASNLFGWSAKRTMQVAQNLYEEGLITYHRTDSTNLAVEAIQAARDFIINIYGKNYVPVEVRLYKTKSKVAQEAHEAIRPTNLNKTDLDRDQKRLFDLIWNRFVACQMADAISEQTSIDIGARGKGLGVSYIFRANGSRVVFDGWQKLFERDIAEELPELTKDQILKLLELIPSQHFTEPPPRYTEASLIKALEEFGIGRPSTYAPIISTIQERQYVEKEDKKLLPTALGMAVNEFLMTNFPNILDFQFTAKMEDELDEIANGKKQWVPVVREFYIPFEAQLKTVGETAERVKVVAEVSGEKCPKCGADMVVRIGKFGKFLACSKFPDCKTTASLVVKANVKCPKCDGEVILKRTKSKKTFYGCSNYPNCDFASWTKPK